MMLFPSKICTNFSLSTLGASNRCISQKLDGGDGVLTRRRGLIDSAPQTMVADEFYDSKDRVRGGANTRSKNVAGVDLQEASDEDFANRHSAW